MTALSPTSLAPTCSDTGETMPIGADMALSSSSSPRTALAGARPSRLRRRLKTALPTVLIATVLCLTTFIAGGGLSLAATTKVAIALTIGSGALIMLAVVLMPPRSRLSGRLPAALMLALAGLAALSTIWAVTPDASWQEASLLLAYSAVFIATIALVRLLPTRYDAVLGGIVLGATVICTYALLTKVLPGHLDASDQYARLRAPFEYWNATGITAAIGIVGCLWLGARRSGHALISAAAYPAAGLFIVTLLLSYSRGSLAAALLGIVVWLCVVPLRLRGVALVLTSGACAAGVVAFDFTNASLSSEAVALTARASAGRQLGVLLLAMVVLLVLAGVLIGFASSRERLAEAVRNRLGALLIGALIVAILCGVGATAASHRGLSGTVSHAFSSLTNPNAPLPSNTPGRLTDAGSARARYWRQALDVFKAHPALGTGGGGFATASLRYRTDTFEAAKHAHGYVVQTLADLGAVGAALSLALLLAWLVAAGRATHPFNRRWSRWRWQSIALPYTPERIGLLTMLSIVITFGLQSFEDWTWYVPGTALAALLCAGWLAGRGPLETPLRQAARWRHLDAGRKLSTRLSLAGIAIAACLLVAWVQWQPQRSAETSEQALSLLASNPAQALSKAHAATRQDPLSAVALIRLSTVQQQTGSPAAARATLQKAVTAQPANPETWLYLGLYDLDRNPRRAVRELRAALFLNPQLTTIQNNYVLALRAVEQLTNASASHSRASSRGRAASRRFDGSRSARSRSH